MLFNARNEGRGRGDDVAGIICEAQPSTSSGGQGGGGDMPAIRAVARSPSERVLPLDIGNLTTSPPSPPPPPPAALAPVLSAVRYPASISMFSTYHPPYGGGGSGGGDGVTSSASPSCGAGGSSPSCGSVATS